MLGVWRVLAAGCLVQGDAGSDLLEKFLVALQLVRCALRALRISVRRISSAEQFP